MSEEVLTVTVHNIRGINNVVINMPLAPDVYAITGVNGIGKSTLLMCITPRLKRPISFSSFKVEDYDCESFIKYNFKGQEETWKPVGEEWHCDENKNLQLRGFQEGSITKGTRFAYISSIGYYKKLSRVDPNLLVKADQFVTQNLGLILHNDPAKYSELFRLDRSRAERYYKYNGVLYYSKIGERIVSQFELSTGEFLLINLLHLLNNLLVRTNNQERLNLILIDEIELALHPAAIKRLVQFTKGIAQKYGVAVYFSTHSLEIINALPIDNLFYLQQVTPDTVACQTPSYPAYITRDIYTHNGYDIIILVEDDLAKHLVERSIERDRLDRNKRIQVLPVGGYDNTLDLHQNLINESILATATHIVSIIDGDAETDIKNKQRNDGLWSKIPEDCILFLPIESLEKYLKSELFDKKNYSLMRAIRDKYFKFESELNWFEVEYISNIRQKQNSDLRKGVSRQADEAYFINGKNLFSILTNKYVLNGGSKQAFREKMCNFIVDTTDFSAFEQQLAQALSNLFV